MKNIIILLVCVSLMLTGCFIKDENGHEDSECVQASVEVTTEVREESTVTETVEVLLTVTDTEAPTEVPTEAPIEEPKEERTEVMVPILMLHDIREVDGGTWSITPENFRKNMEIILDEGYTPITFRQLCAFVDGYGSLPEKPVCITIDDGYYSNYKYVLPLVTELRFPVTVFVNCKSVRDDSIVPKDDNTLYKMSAEELAVMEASPYVDLQSHSYALHGMNKNYSETERDNVLPLWGESKAEYKEMLRGDLAKAEEILHGVGVWSNVVFSYPCGKYDRWSEEVLHEMGYRASVTTDYGHRNLVRRGERESLFLLGRMNVNNDTAKEALLYYMER